MRNCPGIPGSLQGPLTILEYVKDTKSAGESWPQFDSTRSKEHIKANTKPKIERERNIRNLVLYASLSLNSKIEIEVVIGDDEAHGEQKSYGDRHMMAAAEVDIINLIA